MVASQVRAAAAGSQAAWTWLVHRYSRLVWSVVRASGLPAADAADAYQLTWLRLLDRIETVQEPARLAGWLSTTARNECHAVRRRSARAAPTEAAELDRWVGTAPAADHTALTADRDAILWQAFQRLSPRCQEVLRVLVTEVESGRPNYAEAAQVLQMPVGSLGPTRQRCLQQLRRMLGTTGI